MKKYQPNRYYRYEEMMELLKQWNEAYPQLTRLGSIGKTYEGRDIPVLELSEQNGTDTAKKPGYIINGNLHSAEAGSSAAVLYMIGDILERYGREERFTALLRDKVIYAIPRVNCDGAEVFLTSLRPDAGGSAARPGTEQNRRNPVGADRFTGSLLPGAGVTGVQRGYLYTALRGRR